MSKIKTLLIGARALIEKPEDWTHGWGTYKCQVEVGVKPCRCIVHAIVDVGEGDGDTIVSAIHLVGSQVDAMTGPALGRWNDTHTHEEVLALLDQAIEVA